MDPKQEIKSIIDDSALLPNEKETLFVALTNDVADDELSALSLLLKRDPWIVPILHINLVSKIIAIQNKDSAALEKILESERELAEMLSE